MKKYHVEVLPTIHYKAVSLEVEADNEEEAKGKAIDQAHDTLDQSDLRVLESSFAIENVEEENKLELRSKESRNSKRTN
jgi:hypothetical protein